MTVLATARLVLRPFEDADRQPFFELNTHPLVVESLGVAATRVESDAMIDRYTAELAREGWSFWAVSETGSEALIGMVGLHRVPPWLPCRAHDRGRLATASRLLGARVRH